MAPLTTPVVAPLLPRVIGHRGAADHAPENTLAGFRAAAALGVRWVEFDVRLSADGRCILLHDDTIDRTTDGAGIAAEMTLEDIAAFDAGGWFAPSFKGEAIPTLEETIDLLAALGLGANIEIKPHPGQARETAEAIVALLHASWPATLPPPLLSSFEPDALRAAKQAAPDMTRGLLLEEVPADWRARAEELAVTTIHCDHATLGRERAADIRAAGYPLLCYTVNRPERAQKLFEWGVSALITDRPDCILPIAGQSLTDSGLAHK